MHLFQQCEDDLAGYISLILPVNFRKLWYIHENKNKTTKFKYI